MISTVIASFEIHTGVDNCHLLTNLAYSREFLVWHYPIAILVADWCSKEAEVSCVTNCDIISVVLEMTSSHKHYVIIFLPITTDDISPPRTHTPSIIKFSVTFEQLLQITTTSRKFVSVTPSLMVNNSCDTSVETTQYINQSLRLWYLMINKRLILRSQVLRLSRASMDLTATGQIVNLMSNDVSRFDLAPQYLHWMWISCIQVPIVTYCLWKYVGISAIIGFVFIFCITIPVQGKNF